MFPLQAFTIIWLFDSNTEQDMDGLCFLREPVLQWQGVSQVLFNEVKSHFPNPQEFPN